VTLEEFGDLELPKEFRKRAVGLIAEAIKPLQDQLAKQVSSIVDVSQEAINARYLQMIQHPVSYNSVSMRNPLKDSIFARSATDQFSSAPHLYPKTEFHCTSKNDYDFIPDLDENFDLSTEPWTLLNEDDMACLAHQASSFDPGAPVDLGCICNGSSCACKPAKGSQLPTLPGSTRSNSAEGALGNSGTDPNIMDLLQNMQRSIAKLEEKLSSVKSNKSKI